VGTPSCDHLHGNLWFPGVMRAWHRYSGIVWGQVRENGKRYFPPPLKKLYKTFTMETYVLSFSNPYLSPSIKLEHGSLVSQGSNINVKEIHNIYISSEYEIPKFTCFSTVHGTCELKFQSPMPNNHCFCHLTDHIKKMPFIKLLCKCVCSQF